MQTKKKAMSVYSGLRVFSERVCEVSRSTDPCILVKLVQFESQGLSKREAIHRFVVEHYHLENPW
jgi:hypothetical protein